MNARIILPRLLLFEAATYAITSAFHFGLVVSSYGHTEAGTAEAIIATVLVGGAVLASLRPAWLRPVAFGAQLFALLATFIGLYAIAVGFGPRTVPDVVYHLAIVVVVLGGLVLAARADSTKIGRGSGASS